MRKTDWILVLLVAIAMAPFTYLSIGVGAVMTVYTAPWFAANAIVPLILAIVIYVIRSSKRD